MLLVLHPWHKLMYFRNAGWEKEWVERAEEIVHDKFDKSYGSLDASWAMQLSKYLSSSPHNPDTLGDGRLSKMLSDMQVLV